MERSAVEFGVLGPITVRRDGQEIPVTSAQQRCVLASLLLNLGRPVGSDHLINQLWPMEKPATARNVVQTHVAGLRRLLGPDPSVGLPHTASGYLLDVDPEQVDLYRFRSLVAAARQASGDARTALLRRALEIPRGAPLADVPGLDDVRQALAEEQLAVRELFLETEVEAGRHAEVLSELRGLSAEYPLRERLAGLLMLALHRLGRRADALERYRHAAKLLAEKLGLDPGSALRELHGRILIDDPTLAVDPVPARRPEPLPDEPAEEVDEPDADVEWATDAPARRDHLNRVALADVMAARLREVRRDEPGTSFLVHLDGPWGAGKSSLLNFLGERLAGEFTLVRFDAWRQARIAPPWWTLLGATRKEITRQRGPWTAWWLRLEETFFRARRTGAPYLLALVLVAATATAVVLWWPRGTGDPVGSVAKGVTAAVAAVGALWAVSRVVSRFLLWDSARGARLFEQSTANPMDEVAAHFGWMLGKSRKPVLFFIDDLDRCQDTYVVELLDSVQTLVRDSGTAAYFVVAADGVWLRTSYEIAYRTFGDAVASPGYPLGHLFLDKLFQLTVPVPAPTTRLRAAYLDRLLKVGPADEHERLEAEVGRARERIAAGDEAGILRVLDEASEAAREDLVGDAAVALASTRTRVRTEHALRRFVPLLDANPRNVKKFLNTYSVLRSVRVLENNTVPSEALALWSILRVRWPAMADHLEAHPEALRGIVDSLWVSECFPEHLRDLARDDGFRAVVRHGPLTAELIRRCCGAED
ncbi:BTAD domain-containing putative transcriptional regulator [Actinosynnema sp. CS-041913]|uniref:BTAD domain-containing putative transcriptional regulator n=1 Tax=Actinosynnema sp. CS-041913 TaxID=3239917 RepID=UPI003D8CD274